MILISCVRIEYFRDFILGGGEDFKIVKLWEVVIYKFLVYD